MIILACSPVQPSQLSWGKPFDVMLSPLYLSSYADTSCASLYHRDAKHMTCHANVHQPMQASRMEEEDAEKAAAAARAVYGEPFADKAKRVQGLSPHGRRPGWAVRPIIVKSGDDCRQVQLLPSCLLVSRLPVAGC